MEEKAIVNGMHTYNAWVAHESFIQMVGTGTPKRIGKYIGRTRSTLLLSSDLDALWIRPSMEDFSLDDSRRPSQSKNSDDDIFFLPW